MKIKLLDERCRPEQHGDWVDLKAYEMADLFVSHKHTGEVMTQEEINQWIDDFMWCDNVDGVIKYNKGDVFKISLGVSMEIPTGYHAQVVARSSTRKHYGVMLTNAIGIIDEAYCGDNDTWFAEFVALQTGEMRTGDRILQFRLVKNGDPIELEYVNHLGNADRGGHGSTGR